METVTINNIEEIVAQVIKNLQGNPSVGNQGSKEVPKEGKIAFLTEKQKIEIKSYPIPEIGDDEILVRVEGCGICGTDVHEYKNDPFKLIPVVLGHEGSGEIIRLGKNVTKDITGLPLSVGDKVVTSVNLTGSDEFTTFKPERSNLSANSTVYGLLPDDSYHFNGWFAEYIILRKGSSVFKVTGLSLEERLLIEPAAVAVHAVERAKTTGLLSFDTKVLVQGCGPIGLLVMAVLRTMGIEHIVAVDGDDKRLEMAKAMGAEAVYNFKNYSSFNAMLYDVNTFTKGGVQFAFQCTGVPSAASTIFKFIRRGGGLCEVGFFVDNGDASYNPHWDYCQKEITAVGSWVYTFRDYLTTLDFLKRAKGIKLPIESLITHKFTMTELNEAMGVNMRLEGIKIAMVN